MYISRNCCNCQYERILIAESLMRVRKTFLLLTFMEAATFWIYSAFCNCFSWSFFYFFTRFLIMYIFCMHHWIKGLFTYTFSILVDFSQQIIFVFLFEDLYFFFDTFSFIGVCLLMRTVSKYRCEIDKAIINGLF